MDWVFQVEIEKTRDAILCYSDSDGRGRHRHDEVIV